MRLVFLLFLAPALAQAQSAHYALKLSPDLQQHILHAQETISFVRDAGDVHFQKQPAMQISEAHLDNGQATVNQDTVAVHLLRSGNHTLHLKYAAPQARGIMWFPERPGLDTAFYCEAWMVCNTDPAERATLTLEIVLPESSGLTAVGPGQFQKRWSDKEGAHFLFEQAVPVQTYLFSFGVAKLYRSDRGQFILYAPDSKSHDIALQRTARACAFLGAKAGIGLHGKYAQAVMPNSIAQEAAGLALMPSDFLHNVEDKNDDGLLAHELAHQWWGVLVGIRSWSDFWLNEGLADFMEYAFLEQQDGRAAYQQKLDAAKQELQQLQGSGHDRPLHWDGWKDAQNALGRIPYVKGALFLDQLRSELGEQNFWRGIAFYTTHNAGRLVDSNDFEHAMEQASGRNLKSLFDQSVFH